MPIKKKKMALRESADRSENTNRCISFGKRHELNVFPISDRGVGYGSSGASSMFFSISKMPNGLKVFTTEIYADIHEFKQYYKIMETKILN